LKRDDRFFGALRIGQIAGIWLACETSLGYEIHFRDPGQLGLNTGNPRNTVGGLKWLTD